jgi:DNA-binding CsgD family transcriptional regulator
MEAQISTQVLHHLDRGVFVVDHAARILFANQSGQKLIANGKLRARDQILVCILERDTHHLHCLIERCAHVSAAVRNTIPFSLSSKRGFPDFDVLVAPLHCESSWFMVDRPVAIVIVSEPVQIPLDDFAQFSHRFGLTPAEGRLAQEIAKGDGLQAAALRLGVSITTARTHLAKLFAKTTTHRQAELVRLLLSKGHDDNRNDR